MSSSHLDDPLSSLPPSVATARVLAHVDSGDLLSFRVASRGSYLLVHGRSPIPVPIPGAVRDDDSSEVDGDDGGSNEEEARTMSENLWRQVLAKDFGFEFQWDVRCGEKDGTLKGTMHLRTFRHPTEERRCWNGQCPNNISNAKTTATSAPSASGENETKAKSKLLCCTRCSTAYYCDSACQRMHYKEHKIDCIKWANSFGGDGGPFLRTGDEIVAPDAFESWKRWKKLRLRFDKSARQTRTIHSSPRDGNGSDDFVVPGDDEKFRIVGPLFLRSAAIWRTIERWCASSAAQEDEVGSRILDSLQPGRALPLTKSTLRYKPEEWAVQSPHFRGQPVGLESLLAIYAFYAGQDTPNWPPRRSEDLHDAFCGLMGSYSAYGHFSSTRLCVPFCHDGKRVDIATSLNFSARQPEKTFVMDLAMGFLYAPPTPRDDGYVSYSQAAPYSHITPGLARDSPILWLEEYASRLVNSTYAVGNVAPNEVTGPSGILLFPTPGSERTSRSVTRGVEVVASAIHAIEIGRAVYSIRIRLLGPGEEGYVSPAERGFETCQLRSRHWKLTSCDTGEEQHARGDGVTGLYPLLREGGYRDYNGNNAANVVAGAERNGTFVYQSMSEVYEKGGAMEGELQFVPGSLADPSGQEFDVAVASFPLPDFGANDPRDVYVY